MKTPSSECLACNNMLNKLSLFEDTTTVQKDQKGFCPSYVDTGHLATT